MIHAPQRTVTRHLFVALFALVGALDSGVLAQEFIPQWGPGDWWLVRYRIAGQPGLPRREKYMQYRRIGPRMFMEGWVKRWESWSPWTYIWFTVIGDNVTWSRTEARTLRVKHIQTFTIDFDCFTNFDGKIALKCGPGQWDQLRLGLSDCINYGYESLSRDLCCVFEFVPNPAPSAAEEQPAGLPPELHGQWIDTSKIKSLKMDLRSLGAETFRLSCLKDPVLPLPGLSIGPKTLSPGKDAYEGYPYYELLCPSTIFPSNPFLHGQKGFQWPFADVIDCYDLFTSGGTTEGLKYFWNAEEIEKFKEYTPQRLEGQWTLLRKPGKLELKAEWTANEPKRRVDGTNPTHAHRRSLVLEPDMPWWSSERYTVDGDGYLESYLVDWSGNLSEPRWIPSDGFLPPPQSCVPPSPYYQPGWEYVSREDLEAAYEGKWPEPHDNPDDHPPYLYWRNAAFRERLLRAAEGPIAFNAVPIEIVPTTDSSPEVEQPAMDPDGQSSRAITPESQPSGHDNIPLELNGFSSEDAGNPGERRPMERESQQVARIEPARATAILEPDERNELRPREHPPESVFSLERTIAIIGPVLAAFIALLFLRKYLRGT